MGNVNKDKKFLDSYQLNNYSVNEVDFIYQLVYNLKIFELTGFNPVNDDLNQHLS